MNISSVQSYRPITYFNKTAQKQNNQNVNFKGYDFNPFSTPIHFDTEKFSNDFMTKLNERKEEIYSHLDSATIETEEKKAPILEHLKDLFGEERTYIESSFLHKTLHPDEITKEGFDVSKINITEFGPGIYFASSEGELEIYHGKTLSADFKGTCADGIHLDKYNRLNEQIENEIRNLLGINGWSQTALLEHEVLRKFVNEYARNQITDKLHIDGASCNNKHYFVVFNPDSLSNVHLKN